MTITNELLNNLLIEVKEIKEILKTKEKKIFITSKDDKIISSFVNYFVANINKKITTMNLRKQNFVYHSKFKSFLDKNYELIVDKLLNDYNIEIKIELGSGNTKFFIPIKK